MSTELIRRLRACADAVERLQQVAGHPGYGEPCSINLLFERAQRNCPTLRGAIESQILIEWRDIQQRAIDRLKVEAANAELSLRSMLDDMPAPSKGDPDNPSKETSYE